MNALLNKVEAFRLLAIVEALELNHPLKKEFVRVEGLMVLWWDTRGKITEG